MPSTTRGGAARRVAHRAGVADGAVEPDLIDAETAAPRHADRQILAWLHDEARSVAYPPGSLSLQTDGSAVNTQYGGSTPPTGDSSEPPGSLPIEPYLKCSSMSS